MAKYFSSSAEFSSLKTGVVIILLFAGILFVPVAGFSQVESDERALLIVDDGISFSKDSLFLMNLRFRMQNRAGLNTVRGDKFSVDKYEMRVRRLRLRFDGFVLHPRFQYYIQLAFSKADMELEDGEIAQPIRDAILYYTVNENLYFGFGQSKLPGNRQRVNSSGNLQFADRSIVNSIFTLDRDFGLFAYYTIRLPHASLIHLKGAISTGDGRNASAINDGLAYTGRVECLPFGVFKNNGDYSEGDLEFETTPKLSIGMTISKNNKANRTGGQLGRPLYEPRDMDSFIVDALFKYRGFAASSEFLTRNANDPITENNEGDVRYIIEGYGWNTQISKLVSQKTEFAVRYAFVQPSRSVEMYENKIEEGLFGVTHYFNGHRIKIQGNLGYRWINGNSSFEAFGNSWTGMFQVEFGI